MNFCSSLPGRAFKGCSVKFLPTKGNEVLISAYKNKISCLDLLIELRLIGRCRRHSFKENQADTTSGSFLIPETNAALIRQGRGIPCLAGNSRSPSHALFHSPYQESAQSMQTSGIILHCLSKAESKIHIIWTRREDNLLMFCCVWLFLYQLTSSILLVPAEEPRLQLSSLEHDLWPLISSMHSK